jgi:hypothetical protein
MGDIPLRRLRSFADSHFVAWSESDRRIDAFCNLAEPSLDNLQRHRRSTRHAQNGIGHDELAVCESESDHNDDLLLLMRLLDLANDLMGMH